jgi:hypothetical protein
VLGLRGLKLGFRGRVRVGDPSFVSLESCARHHEGERLGLGLEVRVRVRVRAKR